MFNSIYSDQLLQYYNLRCSVLSESSRKHELCYLSRFDSFVEKYMDSYGQFTEEFINGWLHSLSGKSGSIENEVIVIRQFLNYLRLSGKNVYLPVIPKVREDYVPYIFSDAEMKCIFNSADSIIQKDHKADPYLVLEFPVIIRLLYSCGLRIGETIKIRMDDVDLENGILRLMNTKGDKHRLVPMSVGMTNILTKYCLAMGAYENDDSWLFPSALTDGHISDGAVKRRFKTILKNNGICRQGRKKHERGPCLHCLRHVFAFKSFAQAERNGRHFDNAIPYLSIYLGHDSLNETAKYLKFSNELFPESMDVFGDFMDELLPEVDYER